VEDGKATAELSMSLIRGKLAPIKALKTRRAEDPFRRTGNMRISKETAQDLRERILRLRPAILFKGDIEQVTAR